MVQINWNLLQPVDVGAAFNQGMEQGRERRRKAEMESALSVYAQDPSEQNLNALIPYAGPEQAFQIVGQRQRMQQQAAQAEQEQVKAKREQMTIAARLLNQAVDEPSYQQSLAAAKQYGIDVSGAPAQYDPAWISQQRMIVSAFDKDGGQQISGIARELQDAGYQPGTPEFNEAMRGVIQNKYASDYVDEQGNTRRRSALNLGGGGGAAPMAPAPQGQGQSGEFMTPDQARSIAQGTDFLGWQKRFGTPVLVNGPEDAASLPAGTIMITRDGRRGVKR